MQEFRKAMSEEGEAIFLIYRSVIEKGRRDGTSDWDDEYPNREILKADLENDRIFVLVEDDRIIAAISMLEEDDLDIQALPWTKARSCVLARLCVSPAQQGKGIAEKLMRLIGEYAKSKGYEATRHLASTANPAANRLYARMGCRNLGLVHLYDTDFLAYEIIL